MKKTDPNCEQCDGLGYLTDDFGRDFGCQCCSDLSHYVGTWKEPIKPKRKRHLLKRKTRNATYTTRDRALSRILAYLCI